MPAQYAGSSSAAKRRWFVTVLAAMVILAAIAGITMSRRHPAQAETAPAPSAEPVTGLGSVAEPSVSAPAPEPSAHTPKTRTTTRKTTTSTAPTAPAGPAIVEFRVAEAPSCPSGTDQAQFPGRPVMLSWKVAGADRTTLSVDGPGIYSEYAAADSATLAFPCSGEPGTFQTHTYTLGATGPDGTTSRELTVKAKVNEIATT